MKTEEKKGKHSDFHFNSYIIFFYSEMNDVLTPKNDSFDNVHVSFFSFFKCNIQYEEENSFNHTSIILSECVGFFSHWFIFFFLFSSCQILYVCVYIYIYLAVLLISLHFLNLNRMSVGFYYHYSVFFGFICLFGREFDDLLLYCFDIFVFVLLRAIAYRDLLEYN